MSGMRALSHEELALVEGGNGVALALASLVLGGGVAYAYRHTIKGYLKRAWEWGSAKWKSWFNPSLGLTRHKARNTSSYGYDYTPTYSIGFLE